MKKVFERMNDLKGTQSTAAFARSIGINQQTMDRYLKGREPSLDVVSQLCLVYGVSADWILGLPDRGTSISARGDGAIAAGHNSRITVNGRKEVEKPDCLNCKYKRLADAFKAL